jgi:hypothetical protein
MDFMMRFCNVPEMHQKQGNSRRAGNRRELIDQVAALLILQSFLDSRDESGPSCSVHSRSVQRSAMGQNGAHSRRIIVFWLTTAALDNGVKGPGNRNRKEGMRVRPSFTRFPDHLRNA